MGSSFFSNPTDYEVVQEGGEGSSFYDGPAYTEIDPTAINNSVAEAAASASAAEGFSASSSASATASAASAATATSQATIATTQAGNAATSAANAATSAAAALVSEGNADTSETNAASSASSASTSASSASTSASAASTSAAAALVSEGNADTSEANAAASASAAATSASNAATSEANAATAVQAAAGTATPAMDGVAAVGSGVKWAKEDHVHPTDTSRADAAATTSALALKAPLDALAYNGLQINGAMEVSQENVTAARTTAGYVVDGWSVLTSGAQTFSAAQVADAPAGLTNSLKVTITGANASPGAGDYLYLLQKIEGYRTARLAFGTASALSLSIGFWTKIHRAGTYSGSIRNSATNRSYPFSFTQNVADTWEFKTATLSGDTSGTWIGAASGVGLQIAFTVSAGTTYTGAASTWAAANYLGATGATNGMAATSDTFQVTGVLVLPGVDLPSSAQSTLIMRPYAHELLTCQRYYCKSFPIGTAVAQGTTADNVRDRYAGFAWGATGVDTQRIFFPTRMRATPTITAYSPNNSSVAPSSGMWQIYDGASTFVNATAMTTTNSSSDTGFNLSLTLPSVTSKSAYITYGSWAADARL